MGPVSTADLLAKHAVLEAIGNAEKRFRRKERDLENEGRLAEAQGAHEYVKWCHRAWKAEYHDMKPKP
jgi:hypothetical protein